MAAHGGPDERDSGYIQQALGRLDEITIGWQRRAKTRCFSAAHQPNGKFETADAALLTRIIEAGAIEKSKSERIIVDLCSTDWV
jgi:hypothetical protein